MKEAFSKVRPACDFQGVLSDEAALNVTGGRMEAKNNHLKVSQPCGLPDFAVSANDFDFAMRKVEDPSINVTDANVILKGGGTTRVKRATGREAFKKPAIETHKIEDLDDLMGAIDDVYPFTEGDPARPWSEGARFDDKTVTATNSVVLCQATLASSSGLEGVTVSRAALSYMRQRRAEIVSWGVSERGLLLEFNDDSWCLASRMSMEMPDAAVNLVTSINDWSALQVIEPEYRGAYFRSAEWADELISVYSDKLCSGRLSSEHDEPAETNLGDLEGPAVFAAKPLVSVMLVADQIGFDRFPTPVPYITKRGSKGLIAGRTS